MSFFGWASDETKKGMNVYIIVMISKADLSVHFTTNYKKFMQTVKHIRIQNNFNINLLSF